LGGDAVVFLSKNGIPPKEEHRSEEFECKVIFDHTFF
jgi:hypothetical protein